MWLFANGAFSRYSVPGCCAARRAAVKGPASRPFGRPSLTQFGRSAVPIELVSATLFPCPGIAGLVSLTLRVKEARLAN